MVKEVSRLGIVPGTVCLVQDPKDSNNFLIAAKAIKYSKNSTNGKDRKFVDAKQTPKTFNVLINTRSKLGDVTVYGTVAARSEGKDIKTVAKGFDNVDNLILPTNKFLQSISTNIADSQSSVNYQRIMQHSNDMLAWKDFTAGSVKASSQNQKKVVSYDEMSDTDDENHASVSSQLQNTTL